MFTVIVMSLLLLPAAILWAIPKTRRSGGDFAIAWKCVPLGCGTMLLIPSLLNLAAWLLAEYCGFPYQVVSSNAVFFGMLVLGLAVGSAVLIKLKNYCWKRHPSEQPRSNAPIVAVFIAMLIILPVILVVGTIISFSITLRSGENYHGPWRTYKIVHEHGTELAFQERSIHPFLAEYDYRFRFRKDGAETFQDLWVNTGGRTYFNVFRLKNGRLLFSDKNKDYIVEVKSRKVWLVLKEGRDYYAAALPSEGFDSPSYGFGKVSGKFQIRIGQRPVETVSVTDQLVGMNYIGCITTGFFTASEKQYQPVTKMNQ